MERVAGIEPASLAWKAKVLPLYHTRINSIFNQKQSWCQTSNCFGLEYAWRYDKL